MTVGEVVESPLFGAVVDQRLAAGVKPLQEVLSTVREDGHDTKESVARIEEALSTLQITVASQYDQARGYVTRDEHEKSLGQQEKLNEAHLESYGQQLRQRPTRKELYSAAAGAAAMVAAIMTVIDVVS